MEAALLVCDVAGITLVMVWMGRGRGADGLFAWRPDPSSRRKPRVPLDR